MTKITMPELANFPPATQGRALSLFLFNLTIIVREIHDTAEPQMIRQLYGINEMYHMVIPFIESIVFDDETTYTIDVVMQNLTDMAKYYDIERRVAIAWDWAQSRSLPAS